MNNTLTYKGFTAKVEFSADDEVFFGRILDIDDIVTFHADTVEELKAEMAGVVDFYIETCRKKGKEFKKSYSGELLFRLPAELHARIAEAPENNGVSINEFGKEVFESAIGN